MSTPASIHEALSAVMGDVQAVKKEGRNTQQGYNFRGVDAVVNAVGPALRKHGVIVLPTSVVRDVEHYETAKGTPMKNVTLTVTFRFYGPDGSHLEATASGEAADSGDKATPKAHSVAYRTLLLQALCIPTDEAYPDQESHERGTRSSKAAITRPTKAQIEKLDGTLVALAGVDDSQDWRGLAEKAAGKPLESLTAQQMDELQRRLDAYLAEKQKAAA